MTVLSKILIRLTVFCLFMNVPMAFAAQGSRVIIEDATAQVTSVETPYHLQANAKFGAVWIALDNGASLGGRSLVAGDAEIVPPGGNLEFTTLANHPGNLIIIQVKAAIEGNALSLDTQDVASRKSVDYASDHNQMLLVAITNQKISYVRNLAGDHDDDTWTPSKPSIIDMNAGDVRWIAAGMDRFKNLLPANAKFVTVEW